MQTNALVGRQDTHIQGKLAGRGGVLGLAQDRRPEPAFLQTRADLSNFNFPSLWRQEVEVISLIHSRIKFKKGR